MSALAIRFPKGSEPYEMCANAYLKSAEHAARLIRQGRNGKEQIGIINTLNEITIGRSRSGDRGFYEWGDRIYGTLLSNVRRYSDKAYRLSEKQLDIICQDFEDRWNMERSYRNLESI